MVTIYDIARVAGVSAMTVSRVINDTGRISEATRKRVRQVMEELQYVPNSNARSLVLQKTNILSLLIADIANPFYTTLARGRRMRPSGSAIGCCSATATRITARKRTMWT